MEVQNSSRCAKFRAIRRWFSNGHGHLKCSPGSRSDARIRPNRSLMPTSPGPTVKRLLPSQSTAAPAAAVKPRPRAVTAMPVSCAARSRSQIHSFGTCVRHMLRISRPVSSTAPVSLTRSGTNPAAVPNVTRGSSSPGVVNRIEGETRSERHDDDRGQIGSHCVAAQDLQQHDEAADVRGRPGDKENENGAWA